VNVSYSPHWTAYMLWMVSPWMVLLMNTCAHVSSSVWVVDTSETHRLILRSFKKILFQMLTSHIIYNLYYGLGSSLSGYWSVTVWRHFKWIQLLSSAYRLELVSYSWLTIMRQPRFPLFCSGEYKRGETRELRSLWSLNEVWHWTSFTQCRHSFVSNSSWLFG